MAICKMSVLAVVAAVAMVTMTSALPASHVISKRAVLLDENFAPVSVHRETPRRRVVVKRTADDGYHLPHAPVAAPYHKPGKVGPVYTFVKTDHHGHMKWGVRHRVGAQYGR